jgi:hypothetical protein
LTGRDAPRPAVERLIVAVLIIGFAIGTLTHARRLLTAGWVAIPTAPAWMNVYWTALTVLNPFAAVLLLRWRRAGLVLAIAIMLSDVAINTYALHGLRLPSVLQAQTLFCGFLLGAAGFLGGGRSAHDEAAGSAPATTIPVPADQAEASR